MALIQNQDEVLLHIYRCGKCGGIFKAQQGPVTVSCAVMHPPGSCCHYGERQLDHAQAVESLEQEL